MKRHGELALALVLLVVGAGGALLVSLADWQTLTTRLPQRVDVVELSGRDVDSASTALGLVALAGVVALLATRAMWRRVVGVVVLLAGAGLVWRGISSAGAVSTDRARDVVESRHRTVQLDPGTMPRIDVHPVWPVLSVVGGVLALLAGLLVVVRGGRWQGMSTRYENTVATAEPEVDERRAATVMWSALDRGEDPTTAAEDRGDATPNRAGPDPRSR